MSWIFGSSRTPQEILKALEDPDPQTRRKAFQEFRDLDTPDADPALLGALRAAGEAGKDYLLPLIDLAGHRNLEDAVDLLRPLLQDDDMEIRMAVLRSLNRIPCQRSLDAVLPLLTDPDLTVRREVREAVIRVYRDNAMGALLRGVPEDRNSPLYFEIVSLMEEMGFFDQIRENFDHPDTEVKKFQFANMVKFHRPEFVPLYLELAGTENPALQARLRDALAEYSPEELLPAFKPVLVGNPSRRVLQLAEEILIDAHPEAREEVLHLCLGIPRVETRIQFLTKMLQRMDTLLFLPALEFLQDPAPQIRALVIGALPPLFRLTQARLADPAEEKRALLIGLLEQWRQRLFHLVLERGTSPANEADILKLFFALLDSDHRLLAPVLPTLLGQQFNETLKAISSWSLDERVQVLSEAVRRDPSVCSLLLSGLGKTPSTDLVKVLLKIFPLFGGEEQETFRRSLKSRVKPAKLGELLDDPDAGLRVLVLDFLGDASPETLTNLLPPRLQDLAPEVRRKALALAIKIRHPQIARFLEEAAGDPDPGVALEALQGLKATLPPERLAPHLTRLVSSPNEEIRTFALREIAKITQKRYLENFHTLPPEVRKLAGKALSKLDDSFVDTLIGDLRSLDPESRLKAARIMENLQLGGKGKEALLAAMKDPSRKVRAAIVRTLGVMGDRSLMSQLIECFNDPDDRVRANAIESVAAIGDSRAVQLLLPFLEDDNNRIRANAALAVWQIGKVNILPLLQKMLQSKDHLMKASGLWVCGEVKADGALPHILPCVQDSQALVRLNALKAIAKIRPEALKSLIPSLRRDPSPEVRQFLSEMSYKLI